MKKTKKKLNKVKNKIYSFSLRKEDLSLTLH